LRRAFSIFALSFLGFYLSNGLVPGLDGPQARGKRIYLYGASERKTPITATLGEDANPLPGAAFPCANCHGRNGQGKPEGGIVPSDIRWTTLTKAYELVAKSGRKHGPYTERSLKRAITFGLDPSEHPLSAGMPHFHMSQSDLADLVAYIRIMDTDHDPGITADQVRLGVILPPRRMTEMHDAVESVVKAYFEEINRGGGIFGRRIEIRFLDCPEVAETRTEKVREFLAAKNVFALTSSFIAGDETELAPIFEQTETPIVAGFALYPQISAPPNPFVFYLDEGVFGQAKALVAFAARRFHAPGSRPAVLYYDSGPSRRLADAVEEQYKTLGLGAPVRIIVSPEGLASGEVARQISQSGSSFCVVLTPSPALLTVLRQGESSLRTAFLVPGSLVQDDIFNSPMALAGRIFLAYPASHPGLSPDAAAEYRRLIEFLPSYHRATDQWLALAAAKALVEALKRTGRDLSREAFLASLESLSNFDTGFALPLSYGPNQHTGNTQIQVMGVDLKNRKLIPENEN
jgi:ABC-type branched-subunit amino acid transport system substrate-binding protein